MRQLGSWDSDRGPSLVVSFSGIDEQLHYLRSQVDTWRQSPLIRNLAVDIIKRTGVVPRDKREQAIAIGQHVQNTIYYVHELPERFQTPAETLMLKAGDCDDTTMLIGALLESIGIPAALCCMFFDGDWRHIFPAAALDTGLLPLDTTLSSDVGSLRNPVDVATGWGKLVRLKVA